MMRLSLPTGMSRNSRGTQEITNMKSIRLFSFISLHLNLPVKISFIVLKNSTMRPPYGLVINDEHGYQSAHM